MKKDIIKMDDIVKYVTGWLKVLNKDKTNDEEIK